MSREISTSEDDPCAWEPLSIMSASADDPISINCVSLEVTYKDSLQAESGSTASDISEDEVQDISKKSELDCAVYKEDHLFEQLLEDYIYDFEDASEKLMSPLDTLETCPGNNDSSFAIERKKTNEELMSQGELAQHCRMLDLPKEGCEHEKGTSQKASWELLTQQAMLVKEQVVDTSGVPNQEEKLVVMRESLLDCIVRDSPIKEVSSFLTQPTGASLKTNACFADDDLFKQDGSDATEKIVNLEGNKVDMGQRTESATKDFQDIGLTVSPDLLDENLDYIRTQMKSNKHLKERLKSNLAHCINKKKVIDSTSPPETEQMQYQMIQVLRHKIGLQQKELRKKENIIEWKMHILGRFLLDMKSMNSDLSFRSLHTDEEHFNAPYVQKASNLLSKIRSLVALTEGLLTCQNAKEKMNTNLT